MKEREFRDNTLVSFYVRPDAPITKKFAPYDIDGERFRLNLETGEISNYTLKDCQNSLGVSIRRTRILMNMLLDMNDFDWFCTLTFDKEKLDRTDPEAVLDAYTDCIHYLSRKYPRMRYLTVPEQHDDGCFHFHLVIGGVTPKELGLVDSGKVCCHWATRKGKIASREYFEQTKNERELTATDGLPVYNITNFIYGFSTATKIANRAACNTYVKKYIDKALGSTDIFRKRFYYSKNLAMPVVFNELLDEIDARFGSIDTSRLIRRHDYIRFAKQTKNGDYNTTQAWIDNPTKNLLKQGFRPIKDYETLYDINEIFPDTPTQLEIKGVKTNEHY
jgi:hypothetical protein